MPFIIDRKISSSTTTTTTLFAKKKSKKKKDKKKQKPNTGFEWANSFTLKPYEAKKTREIVSTAAAVYKNLVGKSLIPEEESSKGDFQKNIWSAPVALIIMASPGEGGGVLYANTAALETVGLKPFEYERLFSVSSDDKNNNDDSSDENDPKNKEQTMLLEIDLPNEIKGDKKYASGYRKKILRASRPSKEEEDDTASVDDTATQTTDVTILDAHKWALESGIIEGGKFVTTSLGVAYAWNEWILNDDILCTPGGGREPYLTNAQIEEAISNQADVIRELKEVQGLGNKDPKVMDEVQKLLRLKDQLAEK